VLTLCAAHVLESIQAPSSYKIWYANFLLLDRAAFTAKQLPQPNLVIANPPFIRFHNLANRARIRVALKSSLGIDLSSFSGTGSYFITRAADLVGPPNTNLRHYPQRLMFFLPAEASGAAHAQRLRADLLHDHGWKHRKLRVPSAQTALERDRSNAVAFLYIFEQTAKSKPRPAKSSKKGFALGDLLQVRRGLSTGRNDFFVLTEAEVNRRRIDRKKWLTAILPTRIHMPDRCFTTRMWNELRDSGHACWLLTIRRDQVEDLDVAVENYLREGVRRGVHATPTAAALRHWFCLPLPDDVPDLFVTYFFRGAPRFILNQAGVLNLTNILGGRFRDAALDATRKQALVDSLNVEAKKWKSAGREYKGGLKKIEPRELSMLRVSAAMHELYRPKDLTAKAVTGRLFD